MNQFFVVDWYQTNDNNADSSEAYERQAFMTSNSLLTLFVIANVLLCWGVIIV